MLTLKFLCFENKQVRAIIAFILRRNLAVQIDIPVENGHSGYFFLTNKLEDAEELLTFCNENNVYVFVVFEHPGW